MFVRDFRYRDNIRDFDITQHEIRQMRDSHTKEMNRSLAAARDKLVDCLRVQNNGPAQPNLAAALRGAKDDAGQLLPLVPDVMHRIAGMLASRDAACITSVWIGRLSKAARAELFKCAANNYGFGRTPASDWGAEKASAALDKFVKHMAGEYTRRQDLITMERDLAPADGMLAALLNGEISGDEAAEQSRQSRAVMLRAVECDGAALRHASYLLKEDYAIVMAAVTQNGGALEHASSHLQSDIRIVTEAVKQLGKALQFANRELQANRQVIEEAVKQDAYAWQYISSALRDDRDTALLAARVNGGVLSYLAKPFRNDSEIVLAAVTHKGQALRFASEALQGNREIVLAAVKQDGEALRYAKAELKDDSVVVLEAVKTRGSLLGYEAGPRARNHCEVVLEAVKTYPRALEDAGPDVLADRDTIFKLMQWEHVAKVVCQHSMLRFVSKDVRDDRGLIECAIRLDGHQLAYASPRLQNDRELVLLAISRKGEAFFDASPALKKDPEILAARNAKMGWAPNTR